MWLWSPHWGFLDPLRNSGIGSWCSPFFYSLPPHSVSAGSPTPMSAVHRALVCPSSPGRVISSPAFPTPRDPEEFVEAPRKSTASALESATWRPVVQKAQRLSLGKKFNLSTAQDPPPGTATPALQGCKRRLRKNHTWKRFNRQPVIEQAHG